MEFNWREIKHVILGTTLRYLEGSDTIAEMCATHQGPALFKSKQQCAAPGIATTRGVYHLRRGHSGD